MKIICTLFRVSPFPTANIEANLASPGPQPATAVPLTERLADRFGPLAPRFKIWLQTSKKSYAGIEVMTFDFKATDVPQAGLILADPVCPDEIQRVDGALRSEMERLGIDQNKISDHHWRMEYRQQGN